MRRFSWYTFKEKDEYGRYVGNIVYGVGGIAPFRKCYEHYRPNIKGGHRHNHIYNVCYRITFRGKYRKRLPREDKKRFVENFWENIALMPDELNNILANKRKRK